MHILLFSVHSPTKVGLGNHGNWFCLVHVSTVFLWGLIDFPEAGELPTQQLSFFAKTSAHLAWRLQWMFIPCVVGEMMQWHQWRERLRDSCHFAYRERIQFERQRDSVTGPPHVGFDALTSAEGDCGAQSTQEKVQLILEDMSCLKAESVLCKCYPLKTFGNHFIWVFVIC